MSMTLFNRQNAPATNGGLARLREEMDRTLERFFGEPFGFLEAKGGAGERALWFPALDVSEGDGEVTITAEVPGVAASDLDINVSNHTLTISGHKEERDERKGEDYYRSERRFGSFRRVVELPESVDADKVTAEADNGVVTIRIAKKPGAKARQVPVKPAKG